MGKSGLFGWLAIALIASGLCVQGVRWVRADAVADLRRQIAAETEQAQAKARARAAELAAQGERDALAAEQADAEREHQIAALTAEITKLEEENGKCRTISQTTVRKLNALR